ncbi:MAG: transglutaminase-like domain-containing protein [Nanoarchaeota archaeon]
MKKAWLIVFLVFLMPVAMATDLYSMDSLELNLNVDGSFELIPTKDSAKLQQASADLLLYPREDLRQSIIRWESSGIVKDDFVSFVWNDKNIDKKNFGYNALLQTNNRRVKVQEKIPFPLKIGDFSGFEQYLLPTETIDSDHPEVIAKASELAEGEDDLFAVAFKLASWVEENIDYDLKTVDVSVSKKGSWVLQNRKGVCDEMTSLFVAMARSLGIPARFVSGISYTNDEEVAEIAGSNWAQHGWAELYFPDLGWVSFDVTFNQYGYIDVTHIKLRDGFDPTEPALKYKWLADGVELEKGKLVLDVEVIEKGVAVPEDIFLEQEIMAAEIDLGSYNMIKGIVKNTADYYTATALNLAVPSDIEVVGRNRRNILLHPQEVRDTYWVIKVPENLDPDYIYTYPILVYSEKNISVQDSFTASAGNNLYSREDIEALTVQDEEKSYSRKVSFDCQYAKEIKMMEYGEVTCNIKNIGNTNLDNVLFCLGNSCENINLPINQQNSAKIMVNETEAGWHSIIVSAKNELIDKKMPLQYAALDLPTLALEAAYPASADYGEQFQIKIKVKKESFAKPKDLVITVSGPRFDSQWSIENFIDEETTVLEIDGRGLSYSNDFVATASWTDRDGNRYSENKEFTITGVANSSKEHLNLVGNWILNLLSGVI